MKPPAWRFVVVGCGRMGFAHAQRLADDSRAVLVGFYDINPKASQVLRDKVAPSAAIYESFDEAVAAAADALVVATPVADHFPQISAALKAGRHVLAEKPLASTRSDIQQLTEQAHGCPHLHCVLGYQRRFWCNYRRLQQDISAHKWGELRAVTFVNTERWEATINDTWRADPLANIGGFVGDAGSHKIDALMYITGRMPTELCAVTHNSRSQVAVAASITGRLSDDIPFTMAFTGNAHVYHEELLLHCDEADLILRNGKVFVARQNDVALVPLPENESGPHSPLNPVTGLLELLGDNGENPAPFSAASPVFDVTQAILQSAHDRQWVSLL